MSLGLEAAGWECVAHAEIEPHARAVLRYRWPNVPLLGDVTQLDGSTLKGITMLTGGSPCQDLSIAGKRAGMTEGSGTRSSLFFEQCRIWDESQAPLILWENVYGAFSSNQGRDFAAVLGRLVGAAVDVPTEGWENAGVASGPTGVAAWRTLDLQHFGWDGHTTPQRRRRVFVLGARAGTYDPAELLLVAEGLFGNLAASGEAGEGIAPDAGRSVASESGKGFWSEGVGPLRAQPGGTPSHIVYDAGRRVEGASIAFECRGSNVESSEDKSLTLRAMNSVNSNVSGGNHVAVLTYDARGNGDGVGALGAQPGMKQANYVLATPAGRGVEGASRVVAAFENSGHGKYTATPVAGALRAAGGDAHGGSETIALTYDARGNGDGAKQLTYEWHNQDARIKPVDVASTLNLNAEGREGHLVLGVDTQQTQAVFVMDKKNAQVESSELAPTIKTDQAHHMGAVILRNREGKPGGGKGPLLSEERNLTLGTTNDQVVFTQPTQGFRMVAFGEYAEDGTASAIKARDHKDATDLAVGNVGVPRRLTPIECERLMAWPDGWTSLGIDEQGREYALKDTPRYKLCGNGIGAAVAAWIGMRIKLGLDRQ